MRIRIRLLTLMRIRIQLPKMIRIPSTEFEKNNSAWYDYRSSRSGYGIWQMLRWNNRFWSRYAGTESRNFQYYKLLNLGFLWAILSASVYACADLSSKRIRLAWIYMLIPNYFKRIRITLSCQKNLVHDFNALRYVTSTNLNLSWYF